MRRSRVITSAVGLTVGALAIWGVAAALAEDDETQPDGPVIAVDWSSYPTAQITGQLRLVEGCLLIDKSVVFWAAGTSWDAEKKSVEFEDADPVRVGESFSGGGGHYSVHGIDGLTGVDVEAISECLRRTRSTDAVVATPS